MEKWEDDNCPQEVCIRSLKIFSLLQMVSVLLERELNLKGVFFLFCIICVQSLEKKIKSSVSLVNLR